MAGRPSVRAVATSVLLLVLSVLAGCGGPGISVADDAWVRTTDAVTQVSVELPGTVPMQTNTLPMPTGEQLVARSWTVELGGDGAAGLMVVDRPGIPVDLTAALAGAALNIAGRVESQTMTTMAGRSAIDGTIDIAPGGTDGIVHMRIVDAGASIVIVQSLGLASETSALRQIQQHMLASLVLPQ